MNGFDPWAQTSRGINQLLDLKRLEEWQNQNKTYNELAKKRMQMEEFKFKFEAFNKNRDVMAKNAGLLDTKEGALKWRKGWSILSERAGIPDDDAFLPSVEEIGKWDENQLKQFKQSFLTTSETFNKALQNQDSSMWKMTEEQWKAQLKGIGEREKHGYKMEEIREQNKGKMAAAQSRGAGGKERISKNEIDLPESIYGKNKKVSVDTASKLYDNYYKIPSENTLWLMMSQGNTETAKQLRKEREEKLKNAMSFPEFMDKLEKEGYPNRWKEKKEEAKKYTPADLKAKYPPAQHKDKALRDKDTGEVVAYSDGEDWIFLKP